MTERPASVLLADPHDEFAAALETTLADATGEFELRHVRDLRAARDAFDPARHGCVLVERDLGSGTGLDLLAAVRRIDPGVPVFVVTADGDEAFAASAVDAGATGYVRKGDPDALADLRDRIRRARTVRSGDGAGDGDADHAATIERLRASAERLDTILEHTTNLVFMKDTDDRYLLVNDAFASLVGTPREEIIGNTTAEVHGGEFAGRFRANDEAAIAAGEPQRFDERYPGPNGDRRFVTVRVPLFDENGEPYAVYGIATDITAEVAFAEERAELLDRMTDAFVALDGDDRITYLNARASGVAGGGRDRDDLVGERVWDVFPGVIDTEFVDALERARETGESTTATIHYEPADRFFETRVYPSDSGVSVYSRDVTEAMHERRELERRESVMHRLHEAISEKDATFEGKVASLLALGREVLGVESGLLSRVQGDRYRAVVVDDATGEFAEGDVVPLSSTVCERVVSTERSLQVESAPDDPDLAERDGVVALDLSCYVGAPVVVDGEVYGTFCFYDRETRSEPFSTWEVTLVDMMGRWVSYELERRETQTEVARERDRLERFASVVSHDLRNPLSVAIGNLDLTRETGDAERLDTAARALDRMTELIEDALSFARMGERVVDVERVDVAAVAERAWETVETADATLRIEEPGAIEGDASRLRTLLENLFRNSVEHGGEGVTVTVGREGTTLFVADDGPGIPEADRETVFEAGFSTNHDGTGFGLGIVSEIATAHGWTAAATEAECGGARIELRSVTPAETADLPE